MTLKSFGCSFIFGSELPDDISATRFSWDKNKIRPSKMTWPGLIANKYNYDYVSYALPGIGNLQILESILQEINRSNKHDIFVIQWSWIDRFDYENLTRSVKDNFWCTTRPTSQDEFSIQYFKYAHSQYRDKLSTLIYIKTAIDALLQNNVRFIMTNIDDLVFETQWHSTPATDLLQKSIKDHIVYFEGLNFLSWAIKNNFPLSDSMHPLALAHEEAAKLLISYDLL